MKHLNVSKNRVHFKVLAQGSSSQAAMMTLRGGESSSDAVENEHPKAEQWVYVIRGSGRAKTRGRSVAIRAGSLVLIEKGEAHQISNTGRGVLVTLNVYAPPAYTAAGEVRGAVE
ncbi:MAG: Cupin 2 conserved barrel domain protein [Phycisphaerales bacterium]|nr:Cupin 2 conserved barrel domain protein [Phycisphaerales bacterium]